MSEQLEKFLYIACDNKDYSLVQTYINRGVNVNCLVRPSYTDWTPLERAAHHGNMDIVKLLLKNGADVNQQDTDGETALMVSSVRGQVETAKILIRNGAKVDLQNNNGWCALMWSSREGHVESIKVLLDHKAQVDLQDKDGDSALIIACKWGKVQSVTVLLKHGANVNLQNHDGSTALICSLNPEISKLLPDNGAQVNHQNDKGETALMWACINEHKETVEMLIKHGADVSLETKEGKTALTLARSSKVLELLKIAMGPSTANHELLDDNIDSRRQSQEDPLLAAVAKAMSEKGILEHTLVHGLFAGPAGSGKSSLMSRLLGEMPEVQSPSTGVARSVVKVKVRKSTSIACAVSGQDSSSSWLKLLYHEEAIATINYASQSFSLLPDPELGKTVHLSHTQPIAPASTLQESSSSVQTRNSSLPATREATPPCLAPPKGYVAPISLFRNSFRDKDFEELRQHFQSSWSLYLTDTGGQIEFQEVLPLLVSGSSIFFITFRLDRDLNQRYTIEFRLPDGSCSESYESSLTVKEMILQILASVASMETATGNSTQLSKSVYLKPKVFIVGTHKDLLDAATREDKITEVDEYLQKTIKSTAHYREDLVEYSSESRLIYAVNNLSNDDSDFQEIRSGVEKVVQRNEYKMSFPSPWLIFGLVLRQQSIEDGIISYEESLAIAKDCGIGNEDELDNALHFLHKTMGLVCHFNVPCLKDVVIRDPQVIFDYVTHLIVQTFSFANVGKRRSDEFKKKGIFCFEDLLRGMQSHVTLSADKFVEILKHLHIVAPFRAENGTTKYFMPCVLVHSEVCQAIQKALSNATNVVPPLLITFNCGYCPKGLAGALIIFLLTHEPKSKLKWILRTDQIFRDRVSFLSTPWDTITLCVHPTYLLLLHSRVLEPASTNMVPIKDVCNCAREFVEKGLSHVATNMKLTSDARHSLSFYCQDENCIHGNGALHPADEVIRNPDGEPCTLKCTISGTITISRPPDGCLTWFGKECLLDLETERKISNIPDPSEFDQPFYTDFDERDVILNHKPKTNPSVDVDRLNAKVKLIFLTCNENEKWAVYEKLQPPILDGSDSPRSLERALYIPQNHTVIGTFAEYTVAVLSSEKGKKCERDLKNALDTFPNAQAIIGIGVAYGKDEKTIQLGDVIVSDHIEDASQVSAIQNSNGNLGHITIGQRGRRMPIKNELLRYFKPNTMEWLHGNAFQVAKDGRISEVKVGTVVSCETLMRSRNHRDQYMSLMAETVGGEMEGCSLLNMIDWMEQERRPLGVIVIKGVSDYGDNKDNKRWQFTAAKAAVDFVHYCLKETDGMAEFNAGINMMKHSRPSHIWLSGCCSKFFIVGMTVAVIVFALVLARFVHVWY